MATERLRDDYKPYLSNEYSTPKKALILYTVSEKDCTIFYFFF